jgi:hypothetical protein
MMGRTELPPKAMLFAGLLIGSNADRSEIFRHLTSDFGDIVLQSDSFTFTETDYYRDEMGAQLTRTWVAFDRLIDQGDIASWKTLSNEIEAKHISQNGRRQVNIDPGYLTLGKVVLATTKNNQHRVYLGSGIFAEVTLRYSRGSYLPWEWTYRDYKRHEAVQFFIRLRSLYRQKTV